MTSRHAVSPELRALVDEMLNGVISAEGINRLELALDDDGAAQQFFRDYCQLHINLDAETRAQRVVNSFADRDRRSALPMPLAAGAPSLSEELVEPVARLGKNFFLNSARVGWLAAACCVAVVAMVAIGRPARTPNARPDAPLAAQPETPPAYPKSTLLAHVQLDTEETRFIPLGDIGHVLLEGPADMEFINPMRARLNRGRIKVRITSEKGHGFVIETPHGEIKDLGTEFGIDASSKSDTGVVVFEGAIDLSVAAVKGPAGTVQVERLVQGEGLTFNSRGRLSRIMSIITGNALTFEHGGDTRIQRFDPIIANVGDNIIESDVRNFYEIVPGGLQEDMLAYVDRPTHEWNGIDERGMPDYLLGADYVKTFNNDKLRPDVEISVTLCRPARLFVFLDNRVSPPDWLRKDFFDTGDDLGLDTSAYTIGGVTYMSEFKRGVGPGQSVEERFSIWARDVKKPGVAKLGSNSAPSFDAGMYGIAAIDFGRAATEQERE